MRSVAEELLDGDLLAPRLTRLLLASLGLFSLYLVVRTLDWPLIHDASSMHYIAWRILSGDAPYRDIFDLNMPGVYLLHMFAIKFMGRGDFAWRLFDLGWLGLCVASIVLFTLPMGWKASVISSLLFIIYHIGGGPLLSGQRDYLMLPFLMLGALYLVRGIENTDARQLALSGAFLGYAVFIKPMGLLFTLLLLLIYGWHKYRSGSGSRLAPFVWFGAGFSFFPGAMLIWLVTEGSLAAFLDIVTNYLPLYGQIRLADNSELLAKLIRVSPLFAPALVLAPFVARGRRGVSIRYIVLAGGTLYGVLHFVSQGFGWNHHLYPLGFFGLTLLGVILANLLEQSGQRARLAALAALVLLATPLALRGVSMVEASNSLASRKPLVPQLLGDLSAIALSESDTVQVLDTAAGGLRVLYELDLRQPTRFVYAFHFFHHVQSAYIRELKEEFLNDLKLKPPKAVVVVHYHGLTRNGLRRFASFPKFTAFLNSHYDKTKVRPGLGGYSLYVYRETARGS